MRRMLAVALAGAALAFPAATNAAAETTCVPDPYPFGVCVTEGCLDHHCIQRSYHVYVSCTHPMPGSVCTVTNRVNVRYPLPIGI